MSFLDPMETEPPPLIATAFPSSSPKSGSTRSTASTAESLSEETMSRLAAELPTISRLFPAELPASPTAQSVLPTSPPAQSVLPTSPPAQSPPPPPSSVPVGNAGSVLIGIKDTMQRILAENAELKQRITAMEQRFVEQDAALDERKKSAAQQLTAVEQQLVKQPEKELSKRLTAVENSLSKLLASGPIVRPPAPPVDVDRVDLDNVEPMPTIISGMSDVEPMPTTINGMFDNGSSSTSAPYRNAAPACPTSPPDGCALSPPALFESNASPEAPSSERDRLPSARKRKASRVESAAYPSKRVQKKRPSQDSSLAPHNLGELRAQMGGGIPQKLKMSDSRERGKGVWPKLPNNCQTYNMIVNEIQCEMCDGRVHWGCAGFSKGSTAPDTWFCPDCEDHMERGTTDLILPGPPETCIRPKRLRRTKKPLMFEAGDEDRYIFSRIIGRRAVARRPDTTRIFQYLVLWDTYPVDQCTWEPVDNLPNGPYIANFEFEAAKQGAIMKHKVVLLDEARPYWNPLTGDLEEGRETGDSEGRT